MKDQGIVSGLAVVVALFAAVATLTGIYSGDGAGPYNHETVRHTTVEIYGWGLYKDMSADVAIQGIAQDYVTLLIGIPVLMVSLVGARRGHLKSRLVLAGTFGYFLVTYLFYTTMAMYNAVFLVYVVLLGTSFFGFTLTLFSFDRAILKAIFPTDRRVRWAGGFLLFTTVSIALMWLSVVLPPLLSGAIYPVGLDHYTTLIVQGLDLGLLLPVGAVVGVLLMRGTSLGCLLGPVYLVFLSLLMTALSAKIVAMASNGVDVVPAVFVIPAFNVTAVVAAAWLIMPLRKAMAG